MAAPRLGREDRYAAFRTRMATACYFGGGEVGCAQGPRDESLVGHDPPGQGARARVWTRNERGVVVCQGVEC